MNARPVEPGECFAVYADSAFWNWVRDLPDGSVLIPDPSGAFGWRVLTDEEKADLASVPSERPSWWPR